ncbi:TcpQ domain-containing protein [Burkholderia gladioli]|uniref:TcpQ domain-containing protein n=1 Tax=Burkholderia gladioli TaxID=28095 RepID=UPI001FC8416A|nr:TcpQ domain-containing protein [Burkholderia gladioli]
MRIATQLHLWRRVAPAVFANLLGAATAIAAPVDHFQPAATGNQAAFDPQGWQPVDTTISTPVSRPSDPRAVDPSASSALTSTGREATPVAIAPGSGATTLAPATNALGDTPRTANGMATSSTVVPAASLGPSEHVVAGARSDSTLGPPQAQPVEGVGDTYRLEAGLPIQDQLVAWCKRAGWTLLWNLPPDENWIVPGTKDYGSDFEHAISTVVRTLARNGADIRGQGHRDNHIFIVRPGGNQ